MKPIVKSLPEFDDRADDKLNMSIEASISNYLKHNSDEKYYDLLKQLIKTSTLMTRCTTLHFKQQRQRMIRSFWGRKKLRFGLREVLLLVIGCTVKVR